MWGLVLTLGFATLAESSNGQSTIVYVTPQPQPYYMAFYPGTYDANIDIDGNGTTDFILRSNDPDTGVNNVQLIPQGSNGEVIMAFFVGNMNTGDTIGSSLDPVYEWIYTKRPISTIAELLSYTVEGGNFAHQEFGYIGFDLVKNGLNYYGWMAVSSPGMGGLPGDAALDGSIVSWAYETLPNTPITVGAVPEPSTVTLLITGGAALWLRRIRK